MRRAALSLLKLVLTTFLHEVEFEPGAPTRFSQGHVMVAKVRHFNLIAFKRQILSFNFFDRLFLDAPIQMVQYAIWLSIASV